VYSEGKCVTESAIVEIAKLFYDEMEIADRCTFSGG
jgi:hypothetical protein